MADAKKDKLQIRNSTVDFLVFTKDAHEDGIEVRVQDHDVWLTQKAIARLFDVDRSVVTKHLKNVYESGELSEDLFNSFVTNYDYRTNMIRLTRDAKENGNYTDYTNMEFIDKAAIINARAEEFERVKNYLDELKANVNSKNNGLESIPSILPIDSRYAVISIPYQKNSLTSKGVGFETIAGTLIRSTAAGTVHSITYNNNEGFTIVIYHRLGIITTYRGLATSLVEENKDLKKGEIIGSAKTGILEYELTLATENANPLIFTSFN